MEMSISNFAKRFGLTALIVVSFALHGTAVQAQELGRAPLRRDRSSAASTAAPIPHIVMSRDWGRRIEEGRGAAPAASPSTTRRQVRVGNQKPLLARPRPGVVSRPRRDPKSTNSMSQGRRSGALVGGCSCGPMASMSTEMGMCGWPTHELRARTNSKKFPERNKTREAWSSRVQPRRRTVLLTLGKPAVRGNPPRSH